MLNQYGQEEDPNALMVPDWAPQATETPPTQIQAPQGGLDALANIGQPPAPVEGPAEMPGDRSPPPQQFEGPGELPGDRTQDVPGSDIKFAQPVEPPKSAELDASGTPKLADASAAILQPPPPGSVMPQMPPGADKMHVAQKLQSPEMQTVNQNVDAITQAKITAEKNDLAVKNAKALEEQKFAEQNAQRQAEKEQRLAELMKDHDARLAQAEARNSAAYEDAKNFKFHDFWSNKTTGDRILAAVSVFLGGLGTAYGGENTANKNLQSLIAMDYQKQKDELQKKWDFAARSDKDLDRVNSGRDRAITDLNLKFAAATESAATERAKMMSKYGVPDEQIASDKKILDLQAEGEKFKQQSAKDTEATVSWETKRKAAGGAGGGGGALSKLHEFARLHEGPENEHLVVAEAERLFPGQKPAQLQTLVAGAVKANADAHEHAGSSVPTTFEAGGKHYVVDPAQTTVRGHTAARAQLGLIEGAIKNGDDALALISNKAPTNFGMLNGNTERSTADAQIASLRNAAASALKESMGQEAGKERAEAIFPTVPRTDMGIPQWRAKVKAGLDTMKVLRQEALNAAGAKEATGESPNPSRTTAAAAPAAPAPEPSRQVKAAAATRVMSDPSAPPAARKRAQEFLHTLGN